MLRTIKAYNSIYLQSIRIRLILIVLLMGIGLNSALGQRGQQIISNFSPLSYSSDAFNSSPQNWCVETDENGRVVVSNTSGILVFDGVEWAMIPETEGKLLFKLAKDRTGRLFTGGDGEIGYLYADEKGEMQYHSILDQLDSLDQAFSRITNVVSYKGDVYFKSKSHLIRYSNGILTTWKADVRFRKLVSSSAGLFLSETDAWYKFENNSLNKVFTPTSGTPPDLRAVFNGPDNALLIVTQNQGLFQLKNNKLTSLPLDLGVFTTLNACELSQGKIALATSEHGIIVINNKGRILEMINESAGLSGNSTIFPSYSKGDLWVAMNSGVSLINYPFNTSILDKKNGLNGFALSMSRFQGKLYVGTNEGAYSITQDELTSSGKITSLANPMTQVFNIVQVGDRLVISNAKGLLVIVNDKDQYSIDGPSRNQCSSLLASKIHDDVVYAIYGSLIVPSRLSDHSHKELSKPMELKHPAYSMVEKPNGDLWAAWEGISFIDLSKGFDAPKITSLDSSNGVIPEMGVFEVKMINGEVVFGTEIGLYSYDQKTKKLVPNPMLGKKFCDGSTMAYNLTEMRNGDVWVTTDGQTGLLRKQKDNTFIYDSLVLVRAGISDVWNIYEEDDGIVWICGTEAVVRYDPSIKVDYQTPYKAFIRSVIINDKEKIFAGYYSDKNGFPSVKQPESYIPTLSYDQNDLTFNYGAADYSKDYKLDYRVMLVGKDQTWSSWRDAVKMDYTNLREGTYTFKVQSRNVYGTISEEAEYTFKILPPWYRTTWAYILFTIAGILFILLIVWLNTKRLIRDKRKLEGIVEERTEEVRMQKDEIAKEKLKSDNLLENILPKEIAKELKTHGKARSRLFESVTVMFTDFKGFTEFAEDMSPEDLVKELNACFCAFDEIMLRHGVEKIKTIGDAYMCVGGLPIANETHPVDVLNAGVEVIDFMNKRKEDHIANGRKYLELRIGLHTGPVVAGIVGISKFQYDIWGDTVNMASRVESNGVVGKVNLSEETYLFVKDRYTCSYRGEIDVKGKGRKKMYFLD